MRHVRDSFWAALTVAGIVVSCTSGNSAGPCNAGEFRCAGDELQLCESGSGFRKVSACGTGLCDFANHRCLVCTPSSNTCGTATQKRACSPDGMSYTEEPCSGDTPYCDNGGCVECSDGTQCSSVGVACKVNQCLANKCELANASRGSPCGSGGVCSGDGVCWDCLPNTNTCFGNAPRACDANGKATVLPTCTGVKPYCKDGVCSGCSDDAQCAPSAEACQKPKCLTSGVCGFAAVANGTLCGSSGQCSNGQCTSCTPGNRACNGDTPQVCLENGTYLLQTSCTTPLPYCTGQGVCVQCNATTQCASPTDLCRVAQCSLNTCVAALADDGAACGSGIDGVCSQGKCVQCGPGATRCRPDVLEVPQYCTGYGQWVDQNSCRSPTPYCRAGTCASTVCGNGIVESGEECDNGIAPPALCTGCESCYNRHMAVLPTGTRGLVSSIALPSSNRDACYEAWFMLLAGSDRLILSSKGAAAYQTHFAIGCTIDAVSNVSYPYFFGSNQFGTDSGAGQTVQVSIPSAPRCADGKWHHIAGCRQYTASDARVVLTLFYDGALIGSSQPLPASWIYAPQTLVIGESGSAQLYIDEIRISRKVRYIGDYVVQRRFTRDFDTVALYHFDEVGGLVFNDDGYVAPTPVADAGADSGRDGGDAAVPTPANQGVLTQGVNWPIDKGYGRTEFCR